MISGRAESTFASAARELRFEGVEPLAPEHSEVLEPTIQLAERAGIDGIQAPCALGPDGREAVLPEHLQVLRDRRLRDAELSLDGSKVRLI